jgi:hypothetical protein
MLKRLAQWLGAVFVQWRLVWAWLGLIGTVLTMLFSGFPQLKPSWLPTVMVAISGITSFLILLAGSFIVWKQERDKLEELTGAAHLVLRGLPEASSDAVQWGFLFNFKNEGAIPLERVFVDVMMFTLGSAFITRTNRFGIDYLPARQPYAVRCRFAKEQIDRATQGETSIKFRLVFEYERTERHLRCKGEDEVRFDLDTQAFQVISRRKPMEFPLPPSKWRQAWNQIMQMDG